MRSVPAGLQCISSIFLKFGRMCSFTSTYAMCNSLAQFSVVSEKILSCKVYLMTMLCMQKKKKKKKQNVISTKKSSSPKQKKGDLLFFISSQRYSICANKVRSLWSLFADMRRYLNLT